MSSNRYKLGDVYMNMTKSCIYVVIEKRTRGSEFVTQLRIDVSSGDVCMDNHVHVGLNTETYLGNALRRNEQKNGSLPSKTR